MTGEPRGTGKERTGRPARRSPQRSCIGCRAVRDKRELVRVVHTPDDRFVLDPTGKLSGRGAYLCCSVECLRTAVKRKSFDRAFRQSVPKESVAGLEAAIRERVGESAGTSPGESPRSVQVESIAK